MHAPTVHACSACIQRYCSGIIRGVMQFCIILRRMQWKEYIDTEVRRVRKMA